MQTHISTTPFGRRAVTLGMITSQMAAKSAPVGATVQKWKVFQSIREAKELLGATDRSLTLLNALLSFHLELELSAEGDLIVWPSNEALAARANGMPRILFASSNHTIGFYRQDEYLDHEAPLRPDGLYGVSKCFGEALARMYFEKFGQETALVRIGSCMEKPKNHRMLSTWMSYDDFLSMIECIFRAPRLGCPVIWGCSNNDTRWWDNSHVSYLGWHPKDNAERFRAEIDAAVPKPKPDDPIAIYQGGPFVNDPIFPED